ncbi:TRAP transporter substrate-binding protein [Roseovarius atlanticus]|uniref:TRAP transporter substrate-binding protein n=1 Tax=Roseovarius atlanticus TaxID=1641875 RepID=UPI001C96039F|nr:TRAP transporter substrate-binding protein [Roseovarius atlanticus]MBY5987679.1 TRAP transporter substrate-binding protein [Roseovarius atlanticus]MBY6123070.1 TRAP transporter substrate-binding protein [Roseovarius atlanticus]MBY6147566.1 TRAP transporter substrate-binding protein [Roseovarius atlanticus]
MTLMKTLGGAAVAVAALALPIKAETWDMPTPYPDATFHTVNIAEFAKDVEEATGGDLAIKVHSAGSLFKHPEISKAVRSGQVPAGEFFLSLLANDNPVFGADSLPFLATSYDEAQALWAAQEEVITQLLDEQGLMPLYAVPWPPQGLYTTKEIASVDDLAGLKFRTYNATLEQFANLAGAAPTQVEVPDIPQAFSTGRVEAMITSPSTGVNSKAWDFLTHYTDIQAWIPKNIVVVNKRAFRRLDEDTQTAVLEAAEAAEARGWEMSKSEAEEMTQVLKDNGITVVEPSEELTTGLQEIGAQMLEAWKEEASETGQQLLDAYEG